MTRTLTLRANVLRLEVSESLPASDYIFQAIVLYFLLSIYSNGRFRDSSQQITPAAIMQATDECIVIDRYRKIIYLPKLSLSPEADFHRGRVKRNYKNRIFKAIYKL